MVVKDQYPIQKEYIADEDEAWYDKGDQFNEFYIAGGKDFFF